MADDVVNMTLVRELERLAALEPGWYANVGAKTGEQCCAAMRAAAAEIVRLRGRVVTLDGVEADRDTARTQRDEWHRAFVTAAQDRDGYLRQLEASAQKLQRIEEHVDHYREEQSVVDGVIHTDVVPVTKHAAWLERLFELQRRRMLEATLAWRAAHPGNELVSPDLGALLAWLLKRGQWRDLKEAPTDDTTVIVLVVPTAENKSYGHTDFTEVSAAYRDDRDGRWVSSVHGGMVEIGGMWKVAKWQPMPAAEKVCLNCGSVGFDKSRLPGQCEFCDGTFGGNPPP